jgi:ABC-type nitrate/sulfonate/bicarbonate transport system permease component
MTAPEDAIAAAPPGVAAVATGDRGGDHLPPERAERRRRPRWLLRVAFWGGLLVLWQLMSLVIGTQLLPGLDMIVLDGFPELITGGYYVDLLRTLEQLVIGFAVSCAISIPLGILVGASRIGRDLISPYVNGLYVTSKESLLPLLIIVFGTDLGFQIAIVVLISFFYPLVNTAAGVANIDRDLLETAKSLCTSRRRVVTQICLPAASPYIVAGIRAGLGMAFNAMIIAELWISTGTGAVLSGLSELQRLAPYFAVTFVIAIVAVIAYEGLGVLERRLHSRMGETVERSAA